MEPEKQVKKRVRFVDTPEAIVVLDLEKETPSKDDLKTRWYTKKDFTFFRKQNYSTIVAAKKNPRGIDESRHCVRGLERSIYYPPEKKRADRIKTIQTILDMQDQQKELGINDPEALMLIYNFYSQWERDQALKLAAVDALFAAICCDEPWQIQLKRTVAIFEPFQSANSSMDWAQACNIAAELHQKVLKVNNKKRSRSKKESKTESSAPLRSSSIVSVTRKQQPNCSRSGRLFWHAMVH